MENKLFLYSKKNLNENNFDIYTSLWIFIWLLLNYSEEYFSKVWELNWKELFDLLESLDNEKLLLEPIWLMKIHHLKEVVSN